MTGFVPITGSRPQCASPPSQSALATPSKQGSLDRPCPSLNSADVPEKTPPDRIETVFGPPCMALLPMKTRYTPKLTVVLDLDETLIHSSMVFTGFPNATIDVAIGEHKATGFVYYRPGLIEFLEAASKEFELILFTAGSKEYARKILNTFDPERRFIKYRLYRDSCMILNGACVKDLRLLGRDLSQVVIVDDSPEAFQLQRENGIPIRPWKSDSSDKGLALLYHFLKAMQGVEDVRLYLRKFFNRSSN